MGKLRPQAAELDDRGAAFDGHYQRVNWFTDNSLVILQILNEASLAHVGFIVSVENTGMPTLRDLTNIGVFSI